jgi:hypothetical protein
MAFGASPTSENFRIVMYQMTENTCPHFNSEGCEIYVDRPEQCRAFPYRFQGSSQIPELSLRCSWVRSKKVEGKGLIHLETMPNSSEVRCADLIRHRNIELNYLYGNYQLWFLDVINKIWINSKELMEKNSL